MSLNPIAIEKIDMGPCKATFGTASPIYLGRTQGETAVSYGIDTAPVETEEDGQVDEVVTGDQLTVAIPLVYTDVDTLSVVVPWGVISTSLGGEKKLEIPKAVGKKLSDYADKLVIHPLSVGDTDLSKDVTIIKCYPKPGPINFSYSRNGTRIANVTYVAMEDSNGNYITIGDPAIVDGA